MTRTSYIADMGGVNRYTNPGYNSGFGDNGRFSIFNHYQGLEARAATNPEIAIYLNQQLFPFEWDEMAWQKTIGALELDEDGKQALIASTGVNPHPWPIEAEQNPWAKAGPLGSIWPNPATGTGAYQQWDAMQNPQPTPARSLGMDLSPLQPTAPDVPAAPQQPATTSSAPSILSGLPVHSADLPAALQPIDAHLASLVGGDGTILGISPLVAIGVAAIGFFLLSSMNGGAKHV